LRLVEDGEEALRELGFRDIRFRLHERTDGEMLGIVEVDDPQKAMDKWEIILGSLPRMDVFLDPRGYRQGSLNRVQDP
jgi:PP-loop superfamily ATP-utilizing enzyme